MVLKCRCTSRHSFEHRACYSMTSYGGQEQPATPAKKVVCDPCRKSRRKCDRQVPCNSCSRRAISCIHESGAVEGRTGAGRSPLASLPYILPRTAPPQHLCCFERAPSQNSDKISLAPNQHMCNGALLLSQPRGMCHTVNWCRRLTSPGSCLARPSKEGIATGSGNLELQVDGETAVAVLRRVSLEVANPNGNVDESDVKERASDKQTDNSCARIYEHINLGQLRLALDLTENALQSGTDGEVWQCRRNHASLESSTRGVRPAKNDSDHNDLGRSVSLGKLYKKLAFFLGDLPPREGYGTTSMPSDHAPERDEIDIDLEGVMQRLTTIDHETEEGVIGLLWLGLQLGNRIGARNDHDPSTELEHSARILRLKQELYLDFVSLVVWCRLSCAEDRKALNEATALSRTTESSSTYRHLADDGIHKHASRVLEAFRQLCELDLAGTANDGLRVHAALSAALHLTVGQKEGHGGEVPIDDNLNKFREHLRTLSHVAPPQTISAAALALYDKLYQHPSANFRKARCVTPVSQPSCQLSGENKSRKRRLDQLASQPAPPSMISERKIKEPQSDFSPLSRDSLSQLRAVNSTSGPDPSPSSEGCSSVPQPTAEISGSHMTAIAAHDHKSQPLQTQAPVMVQASVSRVNSAGQSSYPVRPGDTKPAYAALQGSPDGCLPAARMQSPNDRNLILSSQTSSTTIGTPLNRTPSISQWMTAESPTYYQPHLPAERHPSVTEQMYPTANGQPRPGHYWSPHSYSDALQVPYQPYNSSFGPALQFYNNQSYPSSWAVFHLNEATPSKTA